jgi:short subunit dehydrogenase-like uncharacterized protein
MPDRTHAPDRIYDLVLLGATGFVGALSAAYLARHAPATCRWALAGRNQEKLEAVRAQLAGIDSSLARLPLLPADAGDPASLRRLAESTRVVMTSVGPYVRYGEALVSACADAGTDYVDLTGEPEFVDTMYVRHHERATRSGARIVHACGFDSVPHDLGAYFTVQQLPAGVPLTLSGYVRASAAMSGGTLASAVTGLSRPRHNVKAARARRQVEPRLDGRSARAVGGRPHFDAASSGWALPLPTLDPQIVARSGRAVARYGPDFRYSHYLCVPHVYTAAGIVAGVAGVAALAQIPPARAALLKRLPAGEGPSVEKRARSWFRVTFVGEGGGQRVVTQVSGGDPGYDETAKMFAEAALALAFDPDLPPASGQLTTVAAMGDALLRRVQAAGIRFEVLSG